MAASPEYPGITEAQHSELRERIRLYARHSVAWDKRVRYRLGRWLCGRGPFAPFLEAEEFDTTLIEAI
ncbi:MAG TPA: hypothetical protein VGR30_02355 [Candidatus Binatia bacterium]|jgi:hypothetical protein|nr:hypothetical protein [Candidatus Binatia bacterium]